MSTAHLNESNTNEGHSCSHEEQCERYSSTNSVTPNSSGGEKQFHLTNNNGEQLDTIMLFRHQIYIYFYV